MSPVSVLYNVLLDNTHNVLARRWLTHQLAHPPLQDGRHGKADGVLTWRGVEEDSSIIKPVRGPLKPVWQQLPGAPSQPKPEWISLAAAALASEQAAAGAATEDAIKSEPTENAAVAEPSS
jgi:hypothetical protein